MICPVCSESGFKESRQCPAKGGRPVCESCCRKCNYRGEGGNPCRYYISSPEAKMMEELAGRRRRAIFLRKTADRLYARGQNYAASQREAEWRHVMRDIKILEDNLNEKRN